jgi:CRISPR-associated protein Cas2
MVLMFDLPVGSKAERKSATNFRNWLLDQGWEMSQFSVYLRWAVGKEQVDAAIRATERKVPVSGKVHILTVTDRQFTSMAILRNSGAKKRPSANQLELF